MWMSASLKAAMLEGQQAPLTPTEAAIVKEMVETAITIKEVAFKLGRSPKTVGTHLGRAYHKLGVHTRAELIERFRTNPIVEVRDRGDIGSIRERLDRIEVLLQHPKVTD